MVTLEPLAAYMASCANRALAWGEWDCCIFASDICRLISGRDPMEKLRGTYSTEAESVTLVRSLGGIRGIAQQYATKTLPPYRNGDIGLIVPVRGAHLEALTVLWQGKFYGVAPERGLFPIPPKHIAEVFRI